MQNESKFDFKYLKRQGKRDRRLALVLAREHWKIKIFTLTLTLFAYRYSTLTLFYFIFIYGRNFSCHEKKTNTHAHERSLPSKTSIFSWQAILLPLHILYICSKFLTCRTMHICIPLIWLPADFSELYWSSGSHGSHPYLRLLRISPLTIAL